MFKLNISPTRPSSIPLLWDLSCSKITLHDKLPLSVILSIIPVLTFVELLQLGRRYR
ncbi:hypothetical protein B0H14DRAFT_3886188 [Mycena olivaceomarginata]|nr:hypothetical protein B0H14DRAFT_3886188 [Mycena olivaceomarginata]